MIDDDRTDDYLWDPDARSTTEVAAIERLVAPCRFDPVPLELVSHEGAAGARGKAGWVAGLALAAAAAAGISWWLRPLPTPTPGITSPPPELAPSEVRVINVLETPEAARPPGTPEVPQMPSAVPPPPDPPASGPPPPPPARAKARAAARASEPPTDTSASEDLASASLPDKLGPTDILDGIAPIKPAIAACGERHAVAPGAKAAVEFVVVGSTGAVESATVVPEHGGASPADPVAPCIEAAAAPAKFRRFRSKRQTFTYKFRMR